MPPDCEKSAWLSAMDAGRPGSKVMRGSSVVPSDWAAAASAYSAAPCWTRALKACANVPRDNSVKTVPPTSSSINSTAARVVSAYDTVVRNCSPDTRRLKRWPTEPGAGGNDLGIGLIRHHYSGKSPDRVPIVY